MKRSHDTDTMPLLEWTPPSALILFPLASRVGKIRRTAAKLAMKSTAKHAASYRRQVSACLVDTMAHVGVSRDEMQRELSTFWQAVNCELYRLEHGWPDDGAA